MPHKHTRVKRAGEDQRSFNLPPGSVAKALPVGNAQDKKQSKGKAPVKKPKREASASKLYDDTPKAFKRLMSFQSGNLPRNSLDDGSQRKRKRANEAPNPASTAEATKPATADTKPAPKIPGASETTPELPRLQPGERMSDFNARVDRSLPISGLIRKGAAAEGTRQRKSRTEKKQQKMQAVWREDDARRREKEAEALELAEERESELELKYGRDVRALQSGSKRKRRLNGNSNLDDEDDPWAVLKTTRAQPRGLHDVVTAPPQFTRLPTEKFKPYEPKVSLVANVPNAAGSLRRREELGKARSNIIEMYRKRMGAKSLNQSM